MRLIIVFINLMELSIFQILNGWKINLLLLMKLAYLMPQERSIDIDTNLTETCTCLMGHLVQ